MTQSKIDRIISNAELFEKLTSLGTQEEAAKFLQNKGVATIGDLLESDQHRYFAIKNAPQGVLWQNVPVPPTVGETTTVPPSRDETTYPAQKPVTQKPVTQKPAILAPKHTPGVIPDGARINPDIQKALIKFYPESAAWIKTDGIMNPSTRGALNRYKTDHHDDRPIDDPQFQMDLMRKGYLPRSVLSSLEEQVDAFEKAATHL